MRTHILCTLQATEEDVFFHFLACTPINKSLNTTHLHILDGENTALQLDDKNTDIIKEREEGG